MEQTHWTGDRIAELNERFGAASPREILMWAYDTFGDGPALANSFGTSDILLMHVASELRPAPYVFHLDTGLFFPETYTLKAQLEARLGIRLTAVFPDLTLEEQAAAHGEALWLRAPDQCCGLRKVAPLRRVLRGRPAWITGIRRDQAPTRAHTEVVEWDLGFGLLKLNPLAQWTEADVWGYLHLNDLPYNPLHDQGYPSIGCMPCTARVAEGADPRSGRWSGTGKTECGIHVAHAVESNEAP